MAKSFFETAQELLSGSALQLNSKGEVRDIIWTERDSYQVGKALADTPSITRGFLPAQFTPGYIPPERPYLKLVDAYRSGGDDQKQNWTQLFRVNLQAYVAAYNAQSPTPSPLLVWPDMLKNDGLTATQQETPAADNVFIWKFDVIDPDSYTPPALYSTTHPNNSALTLQSETIMRNGVMATVERRYEDLSTATWEGKEFKQDSILPPSKFLPSITLVTDSDTNPTATDVDTGATVLESKLDPINSSKRRKATTILTYEAAEALTGTDVDMETGESYPVIESLVAAGQEGSDVNAAGDFSTVKPLNTNWSVKTTGKATTLLTPRIWEDGEDYTWDAVLSSIAVTPITRGGFVVQNLVLPIYSKYRYSGICRAVHEERWQKDAPPLPELTQPQATPVQFDGIFLNVNIPACLHSAWNFTETSGTNNPAYDYFIYAASVPATNFTSRPASIIANYKVTPHRGGYFIRKTTIYAP